jgi:hypothetical protein
MGLLCWEIYEGTISDQQFDDFLERKVAPLITNDTVCILENAKYHHTDEARATLEQVFRG